VPHDEIGIGIGVDPQRRHRDTLRWGRIIRIEIRLTERLRRVPRKPEAAGMDPHDGLVAAGQQSAGRAEQAAEIRLLRSARRAARHERGHDRHR
jgi:hypothetical protein